MSETPTCSIWPFLRKWVLAPLPILVLVGVGVVLIALGFKDIQIGGLIGKLTGKRTSKKKVSIANTIPKGRIHKDGSIIPIGDADSKGLTQAKVVAIQKPGLFDDPTKVKIKTPDSINPGKTKTIEVDVPDGIKAKDIDKVVIISPEVTAVTVRSESKISAPEIEDLLKKYRGR